MNIGKIHETLKAREILEFSPLLKEAFDNYEDAKLKKLSIFFYNAKSQSSLFVPNHQFVTKSETFGFPEKETYMMNFMKSSFQMFCGKMKEAFMFLDFNNYFYVLVKEEDLEVYINSLFTKEDRHLIIDNDFLPFRNDIKRFFNQEEFEEYTLQKI